MSLGVFDASARMDARGPPTRDLQGSRDHRSSETKIAAILFAWKVTRRSANRVASCAGWRNRCPCGVSPNDVRPVGDQFLQRWLATNPLFCQGVGHEPLRPAVHPKVIAL